MIKMKIFFLKKNQIIIFFLFVLATSATTFVNPPEAEITFDLTGEGGKADLAEIQKNQIVFLKELDKNEHVYYTALHGYRNSPKDYDIKVENQNTGAGVRITGDKPLSKLVFWSASTTVCPEPYIHIKIKPGELFSWKIFYDYYSLK